MDVAIINMPAMRVASIRHVGPFSEIGKAFERLGAIAGQAGLFQQPDAVMIGIYHDDPESTPPDELRSDAGVIVPEGVPLPEGLAEQHIPAGDYAQTIHRGSYEHLGATWMNFTSDGIRSTGRRLGSGPGFEIYRNTPMDSPPEGLVTELYVPLRKRV